VIEEQSKAGPHPQQSYLLKVLLKNASLNPLFLFLLDLDPLFNSTVSTPHELIAFIKGRIGTQFK